MNWVKRKHYYPPVILINTHLAGFLGLMSSWKPLFLWLTPFSLLFSALLVFSRCSNRSVRFYLMAVVLFLLGFFAEVIGVHTGQLFGQYHYGSTLGLKWLNVPLIMGLNWLLLIYSVGNLMNRTTLSRTLKCVLGALLLVSLDLLIEQVAIRYDFWHWKNNTIPLQNYLAWFGLSVVFLAIHFSLIPKEKNGLSITFLIVQFLFFTGIVLFS